MHCVYDLVIGLLLIVNLCMRRCFSTENALSSELDHTCLLKQLPKALMVIQVAIIYGDILSYQLSLNAMSLLT